MTINLIKWYSLKINVRIVGILLILLQSCGIRFFEGQGSVLILIVLFLFKDGFKELKLRDFYSLMFILFFIVLNSIVNSNFGNTIFQYGLVIESYIFLLFYRRKDLKLLTNDLYEALNLVFFHACLGYILYQIFPTAFIKNVSFGYPYQSLYYIFYVTPVGNTIRNTGLMWEPGLLQLMLNLFLFFCIKYNRKFWMLPIVAFMIISTNSSVGYINLGINLIYFIMHNFKTNRKLVYISCIVLVLFSSSFYFIYDNISDKVGTENTSGLARYRDFSIGMEMIKERPIFGHGLFDKKYLLTKNYVSTIESNIFSSEYLQEGGDMSGGYTNGFLGLFCWYGIPLGLILYFLCFKNRVVVFGNKYSRIIFFLILCLTFISEPITYTAFFLIFPFSVIAFKKLRIIKSQYS